MIKSHKRFYYDHVLLLRASAGMQVTLRVDHGFSLRQTVRLPLCGIQLRADVAEDPATLSRATTYLYNLAADKRLEVGVELLRVSPREYAAWISTDDGIDINEAMVAAGFAEYVGPYADEAMDKHINAAIEGSHHG